MIYFCQSLEGGPIKIGCSDNVEQRIRSLEVTYGRHLTLLATMPGDVERETEIQDQFAHLRIGHTEQFRPGADLLKFIGQPVPESVIPESVQAMEFVNKTKRVLVTCTPEWMEWAESFARGRRQYIPNLIESALKSFARSEGFRQPPRRGVGVRKLLLGRKQGRPGHKPKEDKSTPPPPRT